MEIRGDDARLRAYHLDHHEKAALQLHRQCRGRAGAGHGAADHRRKRRRCRAFVLPRQMFLLTPRPYVESAPELNTTLHFAMNIMCKISEIKTSVQAAPARPQNGSATGYD